MNSIIKQIGAVLVVLLMLLGLSACRPSVKDGAIEAGTEEMEKNLSSAVPAEGNDGLKVAASYEKDKEVSITIDVDSLPAAANAYDENTMRFAMAHLLRNDKFFAADYINNLIISQTPLSVTVNAACPKSSATLNIPFSELKGLREKTLSDCGMGGAQTNLFTVLRDALLPVLKVKGATDIKAAMNGKDMEVYVYFPNQEALGLDRNTAVANIKFRALKALSDHFNCLGALKPAMVDLYISAGIENLVLRYFWDANDTTQRYGANAPLADIL
ncbi:MAG: hypothetical protein K2M79_02055 [Muribaculaceae bacterium]|nr:hypothetical protein [Muribaculaceae bacterium]